MKKPNAVKFSFLVNKSEVKSIVDVSFDHDVSVSYPQLRNAPEIVKVKGIALIGDFEMFVRDITDIENDIINSINFFQCLKYKLIEIEQNPAELPAGTMEVKDK